MSAGHSWKVAAAYGQVNLDDLSANPTVSLHVARWILRAHGLDCNGNGTWDQCDLDAGTSLDLNANGIPDECDAPCPADISGGDLHVTVDDLLAVINAWDATGANPADVNGDLIVNVDDLLAVINAWGPCP
jgi:hypothetical protein